MSKSMADESDFFNCVLLNTVKTARALTRRYDNRLKKYGVTLAQFSVMMIIRHNPGRPITGMAEKIAMDRSTLSRNIDLLVQKGLVVKEEPVKGNARTCRLTGDGETLLEILIPQWHKARGELREQMNGQDPETYVAVLQALARG